MLKMRKEEQIQEIPILKHHIVELKKHIDIIDAKIEEFSNTEIILQELRNEKKGTKLLAPIAAGIFVKANLEESANVIVNVGANTAVEKTIEDAKTLISAQLNEISKVRESFENQINTMKTRLEELQKMQN